MNVLFDSAGDQDAKGEGRILIEECERCCDKFLNAFFINTLVETVDEDGIRKGVGVDLVTASEALEGANNEGIHLGL